MLFRQRKRKRFGIPDRDLIFCLPVVYSNNEPLPVILDSTIAKRLSILLVILYVIHNIPIQANTCQKERSTTLTSDSIQWTSRMVLPVHWKTTTGGGKYSTTVISTMLTL